MATQRRSPTSREFNPTGVYLATVVNHLDSKYNGALEVELLKLNESGNLSERTGQIVEARYLSPFQGQTPYRGVTRNDGYDYTQKSYGWWAVPPDVGAMVMVVFVENNFSKAYWIGCVQDEFMNFMVPGQASTTYNDLDPSLALPVAEYNKRTEQATGRDPTKFIKPHNPYAYEKLEQSGLTKDHIRGTNTSSARREVPSMVFGWSTPGPVDRDGPTVEYGPQGSRSNVPFSRLGGSSFVMDDGDTSLLRKSPPSGTDQGPMEYVNVENGETGGDAKYPANDLVRIKTRAGHQILLHNTEDLIYISHGSGNSWIEMTGNGKIDIYSKDSISVHSENDVNITAGRDINMEAGRNVNITANENILQHSIGDWEVFADGDGKLTALGSTSIKAGLDHKETTREGKIFMNSDVEADQANKASVPKRVPKHEPWPEHEHLDPDKYVPDETSATNIDERDPNQADPPYTFPPIPDTFKKPSQ